MTTEHRCKRCGKLQAVETYEKHVRDC
jgi:transcription elongation factor Elf1